MKIFWRLDITFFWILAVTIQWYDRADGGPAPLSQILDTPLVEKFNHRRNGAHWVQSAPQLTKDEAVDWCSGRTDYRVTTILAVSL
jgi:hypothetical protein